MSKTVRHVALAALLALVALPGVAYAQSAITGVVRDTSGGVLPGVTVEASSPALIEGTRTVFTDGEGLYRIENLRPGEYVVVTMGMPVGSGVTTNSLKIHKIM